jgi:uncharacterized membrane protein required for colicin V production
MEFGPAQIVDLAALALVIIGILGGARRGLSGELARVIAIAASVYAAWYLSGPATEWLSARQPEWTQQKSLGVAFTALILAALIVSWLLRAALRSVMTFAFKGRLERIGGAVCGLLRGCIFAAVILLLLSLVPHEGLRYAVTEDSWTGRLVGQKLLPFYEDIRERAPELGLPPTDRVAPGEESLGAEIPAGESPAEYETQQE